MGTEEFEAAAEAVKGAKSATNEEKLTLYGLYKQATVGDVNTDRPGMFSLEGRAKWDAWNSRKGMAKEAAEDEYVSFANKLLEK